jgi:tetratricopeptide (TPR) repeat protein
MGERITSLIFFRSSPVSAEPADDITQGLVTATTFAEWLSVPPEAIRRWHRRGYLEATCEIRRLPYFAVDQVHVVRPLAELLTAGCSLALIDSKLDELARLHPHVSRPWAMLPLVIEGRRILVRQGDELVEVSGQRRLEFADHEEANEQDDAPKALSITMAAHRRDGSIADVRNAPSANELRDEAADKAGRADYQSAIELLRAVTLSGAGVAEDHFTLGELLYRQGDLSAARERYYMAVELDEDYVEARANLGCVLGELGDLAMAEAAFRGALEYHAQYADAHHQLAKLLETMGRTEEAATHWEQFRRLMPDSPWAQEGEAEQCDSGGE